MEEKEEDSEDVRLSWDFRSHAFLFKDFMLFSMKFHSEEAKKLLENRNMK